MMFYFTEPHRSDMSIDGGKTFEKMYSSTAIVNGKPMSCIFNKSKKSLLKSVEYHISRGVDAWIDQYKEMMGKNANH
jgi:hypothetical protein